MSVKAGLTGDLINFVICVAVFFAVGYAVAYFMIGKFHFATPGRLGNYTDDGAGDESPAAGNGNGSVARKDSQAEPRIHRPLGRPGEYFLCGRLYDPVAGYGEGCVQGGGAYRLEGRGSHGAD